MKGAVRISDAESAYRNLRRGGLIHKDFMKLEGTVYEGENYILGEVSLSGLSKNIQMTFTCIRIFGWVSQLVGNPYIRLAG